MALHEKGRLGIILSIEDNMPAYRIMDMETKVLRRIPFAQVTHEGHYPMRDAEAWTEKSMTESFLDEEDDLVLPLSMMHISRPKVAAMPPQPSAPGAAEGIIPEPAVITTPTVTQPSRDAAASVETSMVLQPYDDHLAMESAQTITHQNNCFVRGRRWRSSRMMQMRQSPQSTCAQSNALINICQRLRAM